MSIYSLIWLQRKVQSIDKEMPGLLRNIQAKGCKILALTNCLTGKFGYIPSVEDWRLQELKSLGYHFDRSWPKDLYLSFNEILVEGLKTNPCFKGGVIFTNTASKGKVFRDFLKILQFNPGQIIFVDDQEQNLRLVKEAAKEMDIPFIGVEDTRIKNSPKKILNEARAKFQFDILEKERHWLSDLEADKRLYEH